MSPPPARRQPSAPPPAAAAAAAAQQPLSRAEQLARLRAANQRLKEARQQEEDAAAAASPPPSQALARPKRSFLSLLTRSPKTPKGQAAAAGRGLFSLSPSPQRGGGGGGVGVGGTPLFSPMSPLSPLSPGQRLMVGVSKLIKSAAVPLTIFRRLYGRTPSPTRRAPVPMALLSPDGAAAGEAEERCGGACLPRGSTPRPRPVAGGRLRPNPTLFDILMGSVAAAPSAGMRLLPAAPAAGPISRRGERASMPTLAEGAAPAAAPPTAAAPHGALAGSRPGSPAAVAAARHPLRLLLFGQ
jgi:hypothetical protein